MMEGREGGKRREEGGRGRMRFKGIVYNGKDLPT